MKNFLSVIVAVVLILGVGGTVARGTIAGFLDTEVSTNNYMCAGSRILELSGGPIVVEHAMPCKWYEEEYFLINAGTLEGQACIHIPKYDDPCGKWHGLKCVEDGTMKGLVFNGTGYRPPEGCEPVGAGVATAEPELVAEEGGCAGEDADGTPVYVPGLGTDKCNVSKYIDAIIWFDKNGDGDYDDSGELIVEGKLFDIACTQYDLGKIPPASQFTYCTGCGWYKRTGWGCYFKYHVTDNGTTLEMPLMAAKTLNIGTVSVWNDGTNLYVKYDTTDSGWKMTETHIYAGINPPPKMAPGQFPYGDDSLDKVTTYLETIPLSEIGAVVCNNIYVAAHAVVVKNCGCKCYQETAWGCGEGRKLKLELHFPDVDEDDLLCLGYFDDSIPAEAKWDHWPTNAYMGDKCTFDMVFKFNKPSCYCK